MYKIEITYDTGDSFHQENDVKHMIEEIKWESLEKAKQALKDIKEHYMFYMVMHKEWNVSEEQKQKAEDKAKKKSWYENEYPDFHFYLENDNGKKIKVHSCWTGYFDSLVGADIIEDKEEFSFRMNKR